jgi:RNA polymerase sigma-70 factor (ECF subfamily)
MQVVLDTLTPAERLAFVLHDLFDLPFDEIAGIVGRSPATARQLASRGRRRVHGARPPERDVGRQRAAVDAFLAAARRGELAGLVAVLDPDVVLHVDGGATHAAATGVTRGATDVAGQAAMFNRSATVTRPILVNGGAGLLVIVAGEPFAIMGFTVTGDRIVEIDIMADADRINLLDLSVLD